MSNCPQPFGGPVLNYGVPNPNVEKLQVRINGQVQDAPIGYQIPACHLENAQTADAQLTSLAALTAAQVSMLTQLATILQAAADGEYTITKTGTTLTLGAP